MKILGLDIGAGTKDILLYDSEKSTENCIKMVLPSPTLLYVQKINSLTRDLYIDGFTIGGGDLATRLKHHITRAHAVYMTEEASYTLYNDLKRVKALGITITERPPDDFQGEHLTLDEVNIRHLKDFLSFFNEKVEDLDAIAVALQDHGAPKEKVSQNRFRLIKLRERFSSNPSISNAVFSEDEIPAYYLRMKSAVKAIKTVCPQIKVFTMDSTLAAIAGCLYDTPVENDIPVVVLNIGNSHTTASIVKNHKIVGFMEHHTSRLTPSTIKDFLTRLAMGDLREKTVVEDGGHGAFYLNEATGKKGEAIGVTGPNRMMIQETNLPFHFSAPTGDVMITGVYGLVKTVEKRLL